VIRKRRFLIGGLIICLAVVFLGYMAFMSGVTYYYEVGELLDQASSASGQTVRVSGQVAPDVEREGLELRFTIIDNTGRDASLPVVYQGVVPIPSRWAIKLSLKGSTPPVVYLRLKLS